MEKIESYKDIEIKGRRFRIYKFDARTGSYMLIKVMGLITPIFKGIDFNKFKNVKEAEELDLNDFKISDIMSGLTNLSEDDFNYVQGKCLKVCNEVLPAGETKVLNENDTFGVINLETDTMTIMALTAHALIFNVMGFFIESPLASIAGGALATFRQNLKM